MQRALAPKRQVTAIADFVRSCGGTPKHSDVLELVARLNGAANWNALTNRSGEELSKVPVVADAEPPQRLRAGFREVDVLGTRTIFIGTTMFDELEPWYLMKDVGIGHNNFEQSGELDDDQVDLIMKEGVVVEALVMHPRSDRYGLPDIALHEGMLEWLHTEQGLSSCEKERFELFSEDTGDDSPATCVLTVRLPARFSIRT